MIVRDKEFGEIVVRKVGWGASGAKFSVGPNGKLRVSVPSFVSERRVLKLVDGMREEIRGLGVKVGAEDDVKKLRERAKRYLPKRLFVLAKEFGFSYDRVRLSHASTRWGSCSSSGTISLNIGLMKLPEVLIDYVLIHELAHTREMNHSVKFWEIVEGCDRDYKRHRKALKMFNPSV